MDIGIVGAGLIGRLIALRLLDEGHTLTLIDKDTTNGEASCTWQGGGMLTPWAELDVAEPEVFELGKASLNLWPHIVSRLEAPVYFKNKGSLVVSHTRDMPDFNHLYQRIASRISPDELEANAQWLNKSELIAIEPELSARFEKGLYFPNEGQVDNRELMQALEVTLKNSPNLTWQTQTEVTQIAPYQVETNTEKHAFNWVIDCRGLGAKPDYNEHNTTELRGVKGEIIWLKAPEVKLSHPVRLIHPKMTVYIIPRRNNRFLIGATNLENEQPASGITVQSTLELLSAAFTLHSGFAEAEVLEMNVQHRPALKANLPQIKIQPGLMRVNGLYRNGFLVSPKLVDLAIDALYDQSVEPKFHKIVDKETQRALIASS